MCMIAGVVRRDVAVLAADSAQVIIGDGNKAGVQFFESPKLSVINGRYLMTFVGSNHYFKKMDLRPFWGDIKGLGAYLKEYLTEMRPEVDEVLRGTRERPHFAAMVAGSHNGYPIIMVTNSFLGFEPEYHWSKSDPKFVTLYYGDDAEKNEIFKQAGESMRGLAADWTSKGVNLTPGILAEILTRGIHFKADMEMKLKDKVKYAGGAVNAGCVNRNSVVTALSGLEAFNGGR